MTAMTEHQRHLVDLGRLAESLDLFVCATREEMIDQLRGRRREQLEALRGRDPYQGQSAQMLRLRATRLAEIAAIEGALRDAGLPAEEDE